MHCDCSISKSNDHHHHQHRHCHLIIVQICKRFRGVAQLSWVKELARYLQFDNYVSVFKSVSWLEQPDYEVINSNYFQSIQPGLQSRHCHYSRPTARLSYDDDHISARTRNAGKFTMSDRMTMKSDQKRHIRARTGSAEKVENKLSLLSASLHFKCC